MFINSIFVGIFANNEQRAMYFSTNIICKWYFWMIPMIEITILYNKLKKKDYLRLSTECALCTCLDADDVVDSNQQESDQNLISSPRCVSLHQARSLSLTRPRVPHPENKSSISWGCCAETWVFVSRKCAFPRKRPIILVRISVRMRYNRLETRHYAPVAPRRRSRVLSR